RPENLDDAALGEAANAQGDVEPQRAGRDRLDLDGRVLAQAHDRAFAEIPLDLAQRRGQSLVLIHRSTLNDAKRRSCHDAGLLISRSRNSRNERAVLSDVQYS